MHAAAVQAERHSLRGRLTGIEAALSLMAGTDSTSALVDCQSIPGAAAKDCLDRSRSTGYFPLAWARVIHGPATRAPCG